MGGRTHTAAPISSDPWAAFGCIVSGVAVYGFIGWALGLWLGTRLLIPVGILIGAALGTYMVVARYNASMAAADARPGPSTQTSTPTDRPSGGDDLVSGHATSRGDNA